jgi:large subunit ribosomal protein L15
MRHKPKKIKRMRGSHTHGGGSMKKRRGAGSRGGRGMAGSGKKADQKKPSVWKTSKYFGTHGFKVPKKKSLKAINLGLLDRNIHNYVDQGKARKEGDVFVINLKDVGFHKLLGSGFTQKRFRITVDYASKKAIQKIQELKGELLGLKPKKAKKHIAKSEGEEKVVGAGEENLNEAKDAKKQKDNKEQVKKEPNPKPPKAAV